MKALVVEDSPPMRQALQFFLEKWGHEVVLAENGEEAWDLFQNDTFSIVISDWMMPGMNGPELVRRIRAQSHNGYVFIILLTARTDTEDLVEGLEAGADDFITKPFERDEFRARLRAGERVVELERNLAQQNRELQEANAAISEANQRMREDLQAAANIQKTFLPTDLPKMSGINLAWAFQPCEELAGDMLNAFRLDEDHLALYLLDVSGHGVTAALLSVTLCRILSPILAQPSLLKQRTPEEPSGYRIVPPTEVAEQLNQRFANDPSTTEFFTLIYGTLNIRTREFCYVSAGHPGPILLSTDGARRTLPGGPPAIGLFEGAVYEEHSVVLQPGDRLCIYSDGILEAVGTNETLFSEDQLIQALSQTRTLPLQDSVSSLMATLKQWSGDVHPADDVSLLAVEIEEGT